LPPLAALTLTWLLPFKVNWCFPLDTTSLAPLWLNIGFIKTLENLLMLLIRPFSIVVYCCLSKDLPELLIVSGLHPVRMETPSNLPSLPTERESYYPRRSADREGKGLGMECSPLPSQHSTNHSKVTRNNLFILPL
jgi:hypothetical protein